MNVKQFYKERPVFSTLLLMLLISLFTVIFASNIINYFTFHGEEYAIPDLRGFDAEQLERYERDSNKYDFRIVINDSIFVPDKKGGTVLSQDPLPDNKAKKGRKIYLSIVAWNSPQVEMPHLVDLSLRQAENLLSSNDLQLGQVIYKASKYANAILEQRYKGRIIEAGTLVPYQSKITLVVGKDDGSEIEDEDVVE